MDERADGIAPSAFAVLKFQGKDLPKAYEGLVFSRWLRSLKYGNEYFKLVDQNAFFSAYKRYIALILSRPDTIVRVAVLHDDHDVALGWSVIEGETLHYVHVQREQRNQGVGTALVPTPIFSISHLTRDGARIWPKKLPRARFNPFQ